MCVSSIPKWWSLRRLLRGPTPGRHVVRITASSPGDTNGQRGREPVGNQINVIVDGSPFTGAAEPR